MRKTPVFLFILFAAQLAAQDLPEDEFHPGWKRSGNMRTFTAASLFQQINGGADLFLEFGFDTLRVQRYQKEGRELGLEVYRMKNPEAALGVYLLKCGNETPLTGIPARNSYNRFQVTLLKGPYFIQVNNYEGDETLNTALKALLGAYLPGLSDTSTIHLQNRLPQENQVKGTFRLIRGPVALEPIYTFGPGDIFRLGGDRFALLADYHDNAGRYTRLLIEYPDRIAAQEMMASLSLDLDPYLEKLSVEPDRLTFRDWNDEYGIIQQQGCQIEIKFHLKTLPQHLPSP
jgi:hypothetical protein